MKLFVGLGNPGANYADTRHNVGWMAVDAIAAAHGFGPERAKFQGRLAEGRLGSDKVLILKPETFMNLSGQSVGEALRFHKLTPADVVVFHDELDLLPGRLKLKQGGGHAGHNGLRSLHQHIGPDYARVRIGIGHPGDKNRVSDYVLHPFHRVDRDWLDPLMEGIADGAPKLADGDGAGFQNAVALRTQVRKPARNAPPAPKPAAPAPTGADDMQAPPQGAPEPNGPRSPFDALKALLRG